MERLDHDPFVNHFSHPHPLELSNAQSLYTTSCSACNLQPHGWMYSCKPRNFTLHISCTQMPNLITHPSHPIHTLTLFPAPPYPGGSFTCDGCGLQGTGFSYRCTTCDFVVHMICATNPLSLSHQSHPHQLNLVFYPPYQTEAFSCRICDQTGSNHWLYRCGSCEFDAHMDCAKSANNRPSPHLQYQQRQQQRQQQTSGRHHGADNIGTLMLTMVQGFVEGVAHQIGETVWTWVCGGD